jgi:heme/copper-type cytochrome/quinol oxidase subunit 2
MLFSVRVLPPSSFQAWYQQEAAKQKVAILPSQTGGAQ